MREASVYCGDVCRRGACSSSGVFAPSSGLGRVFVVVLSRPTLVGLGTKDSEG